MVLFKGSSFISLFNGYDLICKQNIVVMSCVWYSDGCLNINCGHFHVYSYNIQSISMNSHFRSEVFLSTTLPLPIL